MLNQVSTEKRDFGKKSKDFRLKHDFKNLFVSNLLMKNVTRTYL